MSNPNPIIVIVEDDPPIRRFLRTALGTHGFETFELETDPTQPKYLLTESGVGYWLKM